MNVIKSLIDKILPLLEAKFPACFRRRSERVRRMEIQLEFPWHSKR
jgi:hypothetical protein